MVVIFEFINEELNVVAIKDITLFNLPGIYLTSARQIQLYHYW